MPTNKQQSKEFREQLNRQHLYETKNKFENNSSRSFSSYAYHLIPPCATRAMSDRWFLGAIKHGEGNWKKGGVEFIKQCFNHMISHYNKELESLFDSSLEKEPSADANLGAILWNAGALTWFKKYKLKEYIQALQEIHEGKFENK